jgi:hypothetical protein
MDQKRIGITNSRRPRRGEPPTLSSVLAAEDPIILTSVREIKPVRLRRANNNAMRVIKLSQLPPRLTSIFALEKRPNFNSGVDLFGVLWIDGNIFHMGSVRWRRKGPLRDARHRPERWEFVPCLSQVMTLEEMSRFGSRIKLAPATATNRVDRINIFMSQPLVAGFPTPAQVAATINRSLVHTRKGETARGFNRK